MLRTSDDSFSVSSTFRASSGLSSLQRSASRKVSRFSGSSFKNFDCCHVISDLIGVGLEHVFDRLFDGPLRDSLKPL